MKQIVILIETDFAIFKQTKKKDIDKMLLRNKPTRDLCHHRITHVVSCTVLIVNENDNHLKVFHNYIEHVVQ